MKYIRLDKLIEDLELEVIYKASNSGNVQIRSSEITRPGLPIVGYFEKFSPERIQIFGSS